MCDEVSGLWFTWEVLLHVRYCCQCLHLPQPWQVSLDMGQCQREEWAALPHQMQVEWCKWLGPRGCHFVCSLLEMLLCNGWVRLNAGLKITSFRDQLGPVLWSLTWHRNFHRVLWLYALVTSLLVHVVKIHSASHFLNVTVLLYCYYVYLPIFC